jgi:hypothetical protein
MRTTEGTHEFDEDIELAPGTVVRVRIPGSYTLEPGGTIDIDYSYELVKLGRMREEDVARDVQERVYFAMAPVLARDPEVAAHIAHPSEEQVPSSAVAPRRRLRH